MKVLNLVLDVALAVVYVAVLLAAGLWLGVRLVVIFGRIVFGKLPKLPL